LSDNDRTFKTKSFSMKKLLAVLLLLASACTKDSNSLEPIVDSKPAVPTKPVILGNATLVITGSLDIQTTGANEASLGIVNYRSSYELCGTAGSDLLWRVVLPFSDSSTYSPSILMDGDTLTAELSLDTTVRKTYNSITLNIFENNVSIQNETYFSPYINTLNFAFHEGSKYQVTATIK